MSRDLAADLRWFLRGVASHYDTHRVVAAARATMARRDATPRERSDAIHILAVHGHAIPTAARELAATANRLFQACDDESTLLARELSIVLVAARELSAGCALSAADAQRLQDAVARIESTRDVFM